MLYWTYAQIKRKVELDLDLQDEVFIEDEEMLGYVNEAIDEAEAEIMAIHEDYFLTKDYIPIVSGTEDYTLPANIYASKIRGIMYTKGSTVYKVQRVKDWRKFEEIALTNVSPSSPTTYRFILHNPSAVAGVQFQLVPPAQETSATALRVWYIRNANRLTGDTDTCDIPEFINFVIQFVKKRCYEKEGHPNLQEAMADFERQKQLMVETLTQMVPDNDNEIEADFRSYEEMS